MREVDAGSEICVAFDAVTLNATAIAQAGDFG